MGFLDHSTNNILVDAVLTDKGRQSLSRNDGSFSIYKFALADDEVDYQIIQQYGRTVGKEKIEKNTPIMEALTAGSLSMKYNLLSASNPFLTHLPQLTLSGQGETAGSVISLSLTGTTNNSKVMTVVIQNTTGIAISNDIRDNQVRVELNDLFLTVSEQQNSPDFKYSDNIAVYTIPTTSGNTINATFTIKVKSLSTTVFQNYSVAGSTTSYVRTFMSVMGLNSGVSGQQEFKITQN